MALAYSAGEYGFAILAVTIGLIPLGLSIWALLDVARRPSWAWALADRDRVHWLAAVAFTSVLVGLGLAVALYYLSRIRPQIAAVEAGRIG